MIVVPLTPDDLYLALHEGLNRFIRAQSFQRRPQRNIRPQDDLSADCVGAVGEYAFAKGTGLPWTPTQDTDRHTGDVAGWQVRCTTYTNGGLLLTSRDDPQRWFALVRWLVRDNRAQLVGALRGIDGMHARYWRADFRAPAFCVPGEALAAFGHATRAASPGTDGSALPASVPSAPYTLSPPATSAAGRPGSR